MRTGLSQADAEKRVNDTIAEAKKAADDARKAAAKLSLWLAASMLAGALASMPGRDRRRTAPQLTLVRGRLAARARSARNASPR